MIDNIKIIVKNNVKFIIAMLVVIILGIFGISYALKIASFNKIGVDIKSATMEANITYDTSSNGANINSTNEMLPINDDEVVGINVNDPRVLKAKFYVTGSSSNPDNSIYDIAIHDFNVDCSIRTENVKWRLYKNGTLLSSGNLSPTFDVMNGNRLVLTDTQEDLTTTRVEYVFLLWISESCPGDITGCTKEEDQSKYLNKSFSGSIKLELATKSKKTLVRTTGSALSCNYTPVSIPSCNTLTYSGNDMTIINEGDGYTLNGNTGNKAGEYNIEASVKDGYKWSDGSDNDKVIKCNIDKKKVVISASNQTIKYGSSIDNSKYSTSGLNSSHTVSNVYLDTNIVKVGKGVITPTHATILDTNGNNVTDNYDITYKGATLTINCLNTATPPMVSDKEYTGDIQIGVSGGENIKLEGTTKATLIGSYKATASPNNNYCWSDNSTSKREYTWSIKKDAMYVTLNNKISDYTGSEVNIDAPSVKDGSGNDITGPDITYNYYVGGSCSGDPFSSAPVNAGSYSVRAIVGAYNDYEETESNCATLTINKASTTLTSNVPSTIKYGTTASIDYTYSTQGNVSCSSSNTTIATCSIDNTNKKVNITPVGVGSANITISATPSNVTNYNSTVLTKAITIGCSNTATEPSVVSSLVYTGSSQTGLTGGSNISLSSYNGINAGSYTGVATPKANYCWSDGTTTSKSYNWSIAKVKSECSFSSIPYLSYPDSPSGNITYSCSGSGTVSLTSSNTNIIKIGTIGQTSASVTALATGSTTMSLSQAEDTNHLASDTVTKTVTVGNQTYTISYDANGGSGAPANQYKTKGNSITLSSTTPTRTNYNFSGWSTSSNGSVSYYPGDTYSGNANLTLYAVWSYRYYCSYTGLRYDSYSEAKNACTVTRRVTTDKTATTTTTYSCPSGYTCSGSSCTSSSTCTKTVNGTVTQKYYCSHNSSYQTSSNCSYVGGYYDDSYGLNCNESNCTYSCSTGTLDGSTCYADYYSSCPSGWSNVGTNYCRYTCTVATQGVSKAKECHTYGSCSSSSGLSCSVSGGLTCQCSGSPKSSCSSKTYYYKCSKPATKSGCSKTYSAGSYSGTSTSGSCATGYTASRASSCSNPPRAGYCDTTKYWTGKSCTTTMSTGATKRYDMNCSKTGDVRYYCSITGNYTITRPSCTQTETASLISTPHTTYSCPSGYTESTSDCYKYVTEEYSVS